MGKREKNLNSAKSDHVDDDEEQQVTPSKSLIVLSSDDDDDEEANEDLSLKIVEKAMLRACSTNQNDAVFEESKIGGGTGGGVASVGAVDLTSSPSQEAEVVTNAKDDKKKNKKNNRKIETQEDTVDVAKEEKVETVKGLEVDKLVETNPVELSDNIVLRKLLRGPRYFDPPDSGWGTCYNCGEEGHTTVNCTAVKRKKPCFVCGSLEHSAKQCTKGQGCFICTKGGHRAKDCPEKYNKGSQSSKICLKCGGAGHDMFSCKNNYFPDDLKEIQCYVCKSFGHLCCVDYTDAGPREFSCYRCGQAGHTGSACTRSRGETSGTEPLLSCYLCGEGGHFARECTSSTRACTRSRGETTGTGSPSSCYRCGEGGHFARECTSSAKVAKRNRELSTPTRRISKENRDYLEVRSVPRDLGKAHKRKKTQHEGRGLAMSSKSKQRGGWITEDPGDLPRRMKANDWRSLATPTSKSGTISKFSAGGHASTSRSSTKTRKLHFGNSASNESAQFYQPRFSASRFGNSSSDGTRRNYDW